MLSDVEHKASKLKHMGDFMRFKAKRLLYNQAWPDGAVARDSPRRSDTVHNISSLASARCKSKRQFETKPFALPRDGIIAFRRPSAT